MNLHQMTYCLVSMDERNFFAAAFLRFGWFRFVCKFHVLPTTFFFFFSIKNFILFWIECLDIRVTFIMSVPLKHLTLLVSGPKNFNGIPEGKKLRRGRIFKKKNKISYLAWCHASSNKWRNYGQLLTVLTPSTWHAAFHLVLAEMEKKPAPAQSFFSASLETNNKSAHHQIAYISMIKCYSFCFFYSVQRTVLLQI